MTKQTWLASRFRPHAASSRLLERHRLPTHRPLPPAARVYCHQCIPMCCLMQPTPASGMTHSAGSRSQGQPTRPCHNCHPCRRRRNRPEPHCLRPRGVAPCSRLSRPLLLLPQLSSGQPCPIRSPAPQQLRLPLACCGHRVVTAWARRTVNGPSPGLSNWSATCRRS